MITTGIKAPLVLERAKSQTLSFYIYSDGSIIDPTSGTITIFDQNKNEIVSAAAVTVSGTTPNKYVTYSLSSSVIPSTLTLSDNWLVEWSIVVSGETHIFRQEACLALRSFYPVVSDSDITSRHYNISSLVSTQKPIATYTNEAWNILNAKLFSNKRPYLIMSSWALREVHICKTLALIMRDLETTSQGRGKYAELADFYENAFEKEYDKLSFKYDESETNTPAQAEVQSGVSVIYLQGR